MAKLIPTLNSSLSMMTGGEKRTAQSLEDNLEDDYTVWYDVSVGPKQMRPDFIILHSLDNTVASRSTVTDLLINSYIPASKRRIFIISIS